MTVALTHSSVRQVDPAAFHELQRALDMESFWQSCIKLVGRALPYSICSLFFDINDFEPRRARHHVRRSRDPDYIPPTSLTVAGPYLAAHPESRLYTFSQISLQDPHIAQRRLEQEAQPEWDEFVQLAFWRENRLEAVLGMSWDSSQAPAAVSRGDLEFLERLYPLIDASLYRLHALEAERVKCAGLEIALEQMPLAVMMIGFNGSLLYANQRAHRQCERWNAGLGRNRTAFRLPVNIDDVLEAVPGFDAVEGMQQTTTHIAHPFIPGFAVSVSVSWHTPGLNAQPCYVVVFEDSRIDHTAERPAARPQISLMQKLTPKERRVALLVAEGLRNDEIAQRLSRSRRTIEFQLASVFRKLGVSSRVQLARLLN